MTNTRITHISFGINPLSSSMIFFFSLSSFFFVLATGLCDADAAVIANALRKGAAWESLSLQGVRLCDGISHEGKTFTSFSFPLVLFSHSFLGCFELASGIEKCTTLTSLRITAMDYSYGGFVSLLDVMTRNSHILRLHLGI